MSRAPRACWFAPGRVNLIGDHTDYQRGWVLPFAIASGTTVTVEINDTSRLEVQSSRFGTAPAVPIASLAPRTVRSGTVGSRVNNWVAYVEGAVFLLASDGIAIAGAHVQIDSDLAVGAGLASSASLTCATLAALLEATGHDPVPNLVARLAQQVENEYVGAPVGYMDPAAVMHGRAGHALLIDTGSRTVLPITLATTDHHLTMVLVDTGRQHSTTGSAYRERVKQCETAAALLGVAALSDVHDEAELDQIADPLIRKRARHVVTENARVHIVSELLRSGRVREIGSHLTDSHRSLRDDFEVSTPELDVIVESALYEGAMGARVTGAGFGGSALVLVDTDDTAHVMTAVSRAYELRYGAAPVFREVTAAAGATRQPL